jgi:hypothetical protein
MKTARSIEEQEEGKQAETTMTKGEPSLPAVALQ